MMNRLLEFYTDGAWSSKSEMGGWAAICVEDGDIIDTQSGKEPYSTNNRMELTAFLSALENIDTIDKVKDVDIVVIGSYITSGNYEERIIYAILINLNFIILLLLYFHYLLS